MVSQKCVPCEGDAKPMTPEEYGVHLKDMSGWEALENVKIQKKFTFKDFREALDFVDKLGALAETEGHHPDIFLHGWNKVTVTLSTHAIKGLSLNDFILAAKADLIVNIAS